MLWRFQIPLYVLLHFDGFRRVIAEFPKLAALAISAVTEADYREVSCGSNHNCKPSCRETKGPFLLLVFSSVNNLSAIDSMDFVNFPISQEDIGDTFWPYFDSCESCIPASEK